MSKMLQIADFNSNADHIIYLLTFRWKKKVYGLEDKNVPKIDEILQIVAFSSMFLTVKYGRIVPLPREV